MRKNRKRKFSLAYLLLLASTFSSCVDNSYDMSKDVDLTMGLGSAGLSLKLVNTADTLFLRKVLDVNSSLLLDTVTQGDYKHLYYVHQERNASFNFNVNKVTMNPVSVTLTCVSKTTDGSRLKNISGSNTLTVTADNIPAEVVKVQSLVPGNNNQFSISLEAETNDGKKLQISDVDDVVLTFPSFLSMAGATNNTLTFAHKNTSGSMTMNIGTATLNSIVLANANTLGVDISQTHTIDQSGTMSLAIRAIALAAGQVPDGTIVNLKAYVKQANGMDIAQLNGVVNPSINPEKSSMDVYPLLPDFMKGDSIRVYTQNATYRMVFKGEDIPVPLQFNAKVTGYRTGYPDVSTIMPKSGKSDLLANSNSLRYFYSGKAPFDPYPIPATAVSYYVPHLDSIMIIPPNYIEMDMGGGRINVRQDVLQHITLDRNYAGSVSWAMYAPFLFMANTRIIYNDSVTDMHKDLKDYQASGILVTADAINNMPDSLFATVIPYDTAGNVITDLIVVPSTVNAGRIDNSTVPPKTLERMSQLRIDITAKNPSAVSRIDKLMFHIESVTTKDTEPSPYYSDQYIRVRNLRLRLKGKIVANFN